MDWQFVQPFFTWLAENPAWSGLIIFLIALTESLFIIGLLVPGTVLMFGVGTLVGTGVLGIQETLLFAFLGAVAGDGLSFWFGRHYHRQFSNIWPMKQSPQYLDKGAFFFEKHGGKSILFGRFIGPIRPIIPAIAGMMGMSVPYFFTMNILSAAVWAPFYLIPGIVFGSSIELASQVGVRVMGILILLLVVVITLFWLIRKFLNQVIFQYASRRLFFGALGGVIVSISVCLVVIIKGQPNVNDMPKIAISENIWLTNESLNLPAQRENWFGLKRQQLNVQWAGEIATIKQQLLADGWQPSVRLTYQSIFYWLKPNVALSELPNFPQIHRGSKEALILIKYDDAEQRNIVLQLWPSAKTIGENGRSLWVGSVSYQQLDMDIKWFPYLTARPLNEVEASHVLFPYLFKQVWLEGQYLLLMGASNVEK